MFLFPVKLNDDVVPTPTGGGAKPLRHIANRCAQYYRIITDLLFLNELHVVYLLAP